MLMDCAHVQELKDEPRRKPDSVCDGILPVPGSLSDPGISFPLRIGRVFYRLNLQRPFCVLRLVVLEPQG